MKLCRKCGEYRLHEDFYRYRLLSGRFSRLRMCRYCKQEERRRLRHRTRGMREKERVRQARLRQDNPHYRLRSNVGVAVHRAVASGMLKKPKCCPMCGSSKNRLEAHHEDYLKPLDVEWLCSMCHGLRHMETEPQ